MTAEILQNTLYKKTQVTNSTLSNPSSLLMFDMDFDTELACVIQDEVHMINDADRGHVWENTILMLPRHIQMVMLSATLDNPNRFAEWIEMRGSSTSSSDNKEVYLATSNHRPVPLTHYYFITTTNSIYKHVKDKPTQQKIKNHVDKLHVIQSSSGKFDEELYHKTHSILDTLKYNKVIIKRPHVLNEVCKHMLEKEMLPAVCFILSKRQIQIAAKEITVPLIEYDDNAHHVRKECEQLLRNKLPNVEEYLNLPDYIEMVTLLEKGIAIHHSGVMPILREVVELMFEKGYVKLLFATETFSVGLNMPIKTVLFTDVKKFDGSGMRMLHSHEFVQASGRAGRRGIDTVGNVVHLPNLFRNVSLTDYRIMMQGKPQSLVSKFKISYNLIFNLVEAKHNAKLNTEDCLNFCNRSMIQDEISKHIKLTEKDLEVAQKSLDNAQTHLNAIRTPRDVIEKYLEIQENIPKSKTRRANN